MEEFEYDEEFAWDLSETLQRIDNSDDTSEVLAAADEYFSIQQEA